VRDIALHLLDVDIRRLSFARDGGDLPQPGSAIESYSDLVKFLNRLNADWVSAGRRISSRLPIELLGLTGPLVAEHVASLDMQAVARFPVAWAGEQVSLNWFDVGRDYTERWHHQQQIRDAVNASGSCDIHARASSCLSGGWGAKRRRDRDRDRRRRGPKLVPYLYEWRVEALRR
jgi:hypothetical protein